MMMGLAQPLTRLQDAVDKFTRMTDVGFTARSL
jgi:hypothetical protein